jgi:hypothetical protein
MTRAKPSPATGALRAIAAALEALAEAHKSAQPPVEQSAHAPAVEILLARQLAVEHLGRWIYVPTPPRDLTAATRPFPEHGAIAGRLVGIMPGSVPTTLLRGEDQYATTKLVLLNAGPHSVRLSDRVEVAPREWS